MSAVGQDVDASDGVYSGVWACAASMVVVGPPVELLVTIVGLTLCLVTGSTLYSNRTFKQHRVRRSR